MEDSKLIECKYGKHLCSEDEFSPSGLNMKYKNFTKCRKCKAEEMKRYRQKHKEEYNEKHKLYLRKWRSESNVEIEV